MPASSPPPFVRDPGTWACYLLLGYFSFVLSTFGGVLPALRLELGLSFSQASEPALEPLRPRPAAGEPRR